jgi:hypothetical protein
MAQIISYPTGTATSADFLLGIQKTTTGAQANPTQKFTMSDVVSAGSSATTVTIDVSNAEWLALNGASKTLVAAPGAGKAIKVTELSVFFDFGTTNFTFAGNIGVSINSVNMGLVASVDSPLSADTVYSLPVDGGASNGVKLATNTALLLTAAGATGGDGVVKVKIKYEILDTANF